jgi:hypothetical protein
LGALRCIYLSTNQAAAPKRIYVAESKSEEASHEEMSGATKGDWMGGNSKECRPLELPAIHEGSQSGLHDLDGQLEEGYEDVALRKVSLLVRDI